MREAQPLQGHAPQGLKSEWPNGHSLGYEDGEESQSSPPLWLMAGRAIREGGLARPHVGACEQSPSMLPPGRLERQ